MTRGRLTHRWATREDLRKAYGDMPLPSMRAYVFEDENGDIAAIGGISYIDGNPIAFSDIFDKELPKITIWRCAQVVMDLISERATTVFALCVTPQAEKFLKRLGFEHFESGQEGEVYIWPS